MKKSTIKFILESFNKDNCINPKWISHVTDKLYDEIKSQTKKTDFDYLIEDKLSKSKRIMLRDFQNQKWGLKGSYDRIIEYLEKNEIKYTILNPYSIVNEKNALIETF